MWSGQKFDRWKIEVERWYENNKASDEDKYIDLIESLKKNEAIKYFVNRTLIEKVGTIVSQEEEFRVRHQRERKVSCSRR